MSYEATLVVVVDRKTNKEKERYLINKQSATKSLEEYLAPAAEYLAQSIKAGEVRNKCLTSIMCVV